MSVDDPTGAALAGVAHDGAQAGRNRWLAHPGFVCGVLIVAVVVALALVALLWTPYSAYDLDIAQRLRPPSAAHWLGTDQMGRDILSMLMVGAQGSIVISLTAVLISVGVGVTLGLVAAARRGWIDELLMRIADFTFAFPAVLSAIMITTILGPRAVNAIIAIGIFYIPVFARLTRGAAKSIWAREFVLAARVAGKSPFTISIEHVLPNIANLLIVQATISFALAILAEAALSYLGLGTQPPEPSWGRMLQEAQAFMFKAPWLAVFPGLAIAFTVLGLNLLGDGLRDLIDPKLARER